MVGCRFFQRLAHRLDTHALDQAQDDQFVGQQLQSPMAAALGRITAGQLDEALFDIPLDLDLIGPRRLPPAQQGEVHSLGDQLLADTGDGPQAGAQRSDDLFIGVFLAVAVIGQQQDAGVGQFAGRRLAAGDHLLQVLAFLVRQSHPVLVHRSRPDLGVSPSPGRRESGYCIYLSNEDG